MIIPISNTPHGSILCTLHGFSKHRYTSVDFNDIIDFNVNINKLSIYSIFNAVRIEHNYMKDNYALLYEDDSQRYRRVVTYFLNYMITTYGETHPEIKI